MIPDFVEQIRDIHRNLLVQAELTSNSWTDVVQERFYKDYITDIGKDIDSYVSLLQRILETFDRAESEINELLELEDMEDVRHYSKVWNEGSVSYNPSELDSYQIGDIMNDRQDW